MYIDVKSKKVEFIQINKIGKWGYYLCYKDENDIEHKIRKGKKTWGRKDATIALEELIQQLKDATTLESENTNSLKNTSSRKQRTLKDVYEEYLKEKQVSKRHSLRTLYDTTNVVNKHILSKFIIEIPNNDNSTNEKNKPTNHISKPINKIDENDIKKWREYLVNATYTKGNGLNQKTFSYSYEQLKKVQIICKSIFEFAKNKDYITKNPFDHFEAILESNGSCKPKQEYSIINLDDFNKLINVIENYEDKNGNFSELERLQDLTFYTIMFKLGLRLNECLVLRIGDYTPETRMLEINKNWDNVTGIIKTPKTTNSYRDLYLGDSTHFHLMNLIEYYKRSGFYSLDLPLFSSFTTAKRRLVQLTISPNTVRRRRDKYIQTAKLPHMRIHDFRHSCASHLLNSGVPEFIVAKMLGDTVRTITEVYGHISNESLQKTAANFE